MRRFAFAALTLAGLSLSGSALAEVPFTTNAGQVGGQLMYGLDTEDGDLNSYGIGIAPKGGYTLDMGLFIGGRLDYFFGGSEDVPGGEVSANVYQLLAEVGYDIGLSPDLVVRPKLGVGFGTVGAELCMSGGSCTDQDAKTGLALNPGAGILYSFGSVFLDADLRYNMLLKDDTQNGIILGVGAGVTL